MTDAPRPPSVAFATTAARGTGSPRRTIAIIGSGGAGMTAAWLLDDRHDVTVFERNAVLGGHAHTVAVEADGATCFADDGFGWFSDAMYPSFTRLLEHVGVPTRDVMMSLSFTPHGATRTLLLPPSTAGGWLRTLTSPRALATLQRLSRVIAAATPVVERGEHALAWGEFLTRGAFDAAFCRDFLTPLVAGVWGCPFGRVQEMSAYTLMKYLVFHRPTGSGLHRWRVIRGGAASYIDAVAATLQSATILRGTAVTRFEEVPTGWRLHDERGVARDFEHVILAAGAADARAMLREPASLGRTRDVLDGFEYYAADLATHSDPSFMPADRANWQVANVLAHEGGARMTIWGQQHAARDVFTSYLGDREPARCHHVSRFRLPLLTPAHYRAQERLAAIQGDHGLSFVGDWTRDIGCHEDSVVSAVEACRRLDPKAPRLAALQPSRAATPP